MLRIPRSSSCAETFSFSALLMYWSRFAVANTPLSPLSCPFSWSMMLMTSLNWIANGSTALS